MSQLSTQQKAKIFKTYGGNEKNTGSAEGQIALLTERISGISGHLQTNKKDFSSQMGLVKLVSKRRKLLNYLRHNNLQSYRQLIEKLNIRK